MMDSKLLAVVVVVATTVLSLTTVCDTFTIPAQRCASTMSAPTTTCTTLAAKKKGKKNKGFAKTPVQPETPVAEDAPSSPAAFSTSAFSGGLRSVATGDDDANAAAAVDDDLGLDPNALPEDRTEQILRQKYGLRSYEERQGGLKAEEKRKEARERQRQLEKMAAVDDGSLDIFSVLPPSLINAVDLFLKAGLTVSVVAFVGAGFAIAYEAWGKATGNPLPPDVDEFIVNTVEPNFTPGLLVLLGFSVSLGVFAAAQLGSTSSRYQEKP